MPPGTKARRRVPPRSTSRTAAEASASLGGWRAAGPNATAVRAAAARLPPGKFAALRKVRRTRLSPVWRRAAGTETSYAFRAEPRSRVPAGFSLMKTDTFCCGARARMVIESFESASAVPAAPSPSVSIGTKNMADRPETREAGWPSSFSPRSQEVFHPPSTYLRKSRPPASMTSRPSRCDTACTRFASRSSAVRVPAGSACGAGAAGAAAGAAAAGAAAATGVGSSAVGAWEAPPQLASKKPKQAPGRNHRRVRVRRSSGA